MNGIDEVLAETSQARLAETLAKATGRRISQQAISGWKRVGYVPRSWAIDVSRISGVPIERLLVSAEAA